MTLYFAVKELIPGEEGEFNYLGNDTDKDKAMEYFEELFPDYYLIEQEIDDWVA
jgi:hypothetical protein